jgi:WD40 repeat protein
VNQSLLIMPNKGHKDWFSCLRFHPKNQHIRTGFDNSSVKVWDLVHPIFTFIFKGNCQQIWSIYINRIGD